MISLLPTMDQWRSWSKPTKYEFIGLVIALLAFLNVPALVEKLFQQEPVTNYAQLRALYVSKLESASTCLTARLYFDGLHSLETRCYVDVSGLRQFSHDFAPYMAVTPYSGAWNLENYAASVEEAAAKINGARNRADLIKLQAHSKTSFAQFGYYMCGLEWYFRMSPPEVMKPMSAKRFATYQSGWLSWLHETKGNFRNVPFTHIEFEVENDKDCGSFIDMLD